MKRPKRNRKKKANRPFPADDDIRAAWKLAEKVDPLLLALMEAKPINGTA